MRCTSVACFISAACLSKVNMFVLRTLGQNTAVANEGDVGVWRQVLALELTASVAGVDGVGFWSWSGGRCGRWGGVGVGRQVFGVLFEVVS